MRVDPLAQRQAVWVVVAFLGIFCFQRIAIPGLPISITLPLMLGWCLLGLVRGVFELDGARLSLWMVAAGVSGLLIGAQVMLVTMPLVSINSWLLWIVTWLPLAFRFVDRTAAAHRHAMRGVAWAGAGISGLSVLFMALQAVGVAYRDLLADILPSSMVMQGFVITYPIAWNSPIYKSNAWLALEPSFLSFMLGVAIVGALIARCHPLLVVWLGAGLLCTTAGSGIAVVGVYLVVALVRQGVRPFAKYLAVGVPLAIVGGVTVLGEVVLSRITEAGSTRSSTSLRMIEPYLHLLPRWFGDPAVPWVGGGPGSSQRVVEDLGILGLLVPTPAKMLFDYGLIGGIVMLAMIVVAFLRSPAPELAFSLAFSMLTLQGASQALVALCLLVVTVFAPVAVPQPAPPSRHRVPQPELSVLPRRVRT